MNESDPSTTGREPPEQPPGAPSSTPRKLEISFEFSTGAGSRGDPNKRQPGTATTAVAAIEPSRSLVERWRMTPGGRVRDTAATDVDRVIAALMHLWPILAPLIGPFSPLVPLVLWLGFRHRSPLLDDHGREVLNAILTLLLLVLVPCVGWAALVVWFPVWLVSLVRGAVAGGGGELFRYPMILRPIR